MGIAGRLLNPDDVDACRLGELIGSSDANDCTLYTLAFKHEAEAAGQRCDDRCTALYRLLFAVSSLKIRQDSREEPLGPGLVFDGRRSHALEDFDEEDLDGLAAIAGAIADPELKARVCDVMWLARRDHTNARDAVAHYLDSAANLHGQNRAVECALRAHRAVALAATLGRNESLFEETASVVRNLAEEAGESANYYTSSLLSEVLSKHQAADLEWLADRYLSSATLAEDAGDLASAENCLQEASRCFRSLGDTDQTISVTHNIARVLESKADFFLDQEPPNGFAAASAIQSAIAVLAQIRDTEERRHALTERLIALQQRSTLNMVQVSTEVDLSDAVSAWVNEVSGKGFGEAVLALVAANRPTSVEQLRDQLHHHIEVAPLTHIVGAAALDREGRTIARRPPLIGSEPEEAEAAFEAQLFELAQSHQELTVPCIEAARKQILSEHSVRKADVRSLVDQSPLVPPDRRDIISRGLLEGFHGDFVVAAHILAPQIENLIRHILRCQGVNTVQLKDDGTQEVFTLNRMLGMQELEQIFGEDYTFEFRGLLVEDFGSNARNDVCHGLIGDAHGGAWDLRYLWWFALHFIMLPIASLGQIAQE